MKYNDLRKNLDLLQEEAGEIITIASKCKRYGLDSDYVGTRNDKLLKQEVADFMVILEILQQQGVLNLNDPEFDQMKANKCAKLSKFY